jgi:hypothetical protein
VHVFLPRNQVDPVTYPDYSAHVNEPDEMWLGKMLLKQ